jgi:hypothetical protein
METSGEEQSVLPERDFDGYTFTFLNGNTSYANNQIVVEEQTGEPINDAFYIRNSKVEERYNMKLAEIITTAPQDDYTRSVTAGDNSFDVALLRMEWAMPVVLENQAVNWARIPNLNLDADYWVKSSIESFSLMHNVYFAVSAFDITHYDTVRAFAFNKKLVSDFQLESPYDLVNSGRWTLDKYSEMALTVAADVNNDNKWDEKDWYGTCANSNVFCNTIMAGIGSVLSINKDENDMPYFDLDNETHIERLLRVSKIMEMRDQGLIGGDFRNGQSLFLVELICVIAKYRDMEDDFGIIPAPKYDENQKEYINLGGSPFFMVVPVTANNLDRTGAIMEALAYDSVGIIDKAYYEILLKGKISRDNESEEMLDIIFSTLVYYHPLANSYLNAPLADDLIWNAKTTFTSYFAAVKKRIQTEIDNAIQTYYENVEEGLD